MPERKRSWEALYGGPPTAPGPEECLTVQCGWCGVWCCQEQAKLPCPLHFDIPCREQVK